MRNRKMSSEITDLISDDNSAHQNPFPPWNLSNRRSTLSRVLSPEHANESTGFCSGGVPFQTLSEPFLGPRESATVSMLFLFRITLILVAYNIATSLSLSRYRDGIRSRCPTTFIKGSPEPISAPLFSQKFAT